MPEACRHCAKRPQHTFLPWCHPCWVALPETWRKWYYEGRKTPGTRMHRYAVCAEHLRLVDQLEKR